MAKDRTSEEKPGDLSEIPERIRRYCAYQERCTDEVEKKLKEWSLPEQKIHGMIGSLRKEGFLDDERFLRSFVGGKLRINHWGRIRIRYELRCRNIPANLVESALNEINPETYRDIIKMLVVKKRKEIMGRKAQDSRQKILNFVVGKGFEFEEVRQVMTDLEQNEDEERNHKKV